MIETKEFIDVKLMDGFIKSYLQKYAPVGYDTEIKIITKQTYDQWKAKEVVYIVHITRGESCD